MLGSSIDAIFGRSSKAIYNPTQKETGSASRLHTLAGVALAEKRNCRCSVAEDAPRFLEPVGSRRELSIGGGEVCFLEREWLMRIDMDIGKVGGPLSVPLSAEPEQRLASAAA
jgi:hypothetical protein